MKLRLCRYSIHRVIFLGFILFIIPFSTTVAAQETNSITLMNGVIVDIVKELVYIMNPNGGIDAIDLQTGETRWNTKEGTKPLLVFGNHLVSQAGARSPKSNKLELVLLDTDAQGQRVSSSELELPKKVRATVDEQLGRKFEVQAFVENSDIIIFWKYSFNPLMLKGARLDDDIEKKLSIQKENGLVKLDLSTGKATKIKPRKLEKRYIAPTIELKDKVRLVNVAGRQFLSVNEKYVLSSERIANDSKWLKYRWQIHHRDTGEFIGKFDHFASQAPFSIFKSIILYETKPYSLRTDKGIVNEPLKVRAINLENGQELWSWQVRDTEFRGPFPP